MKLQLKKNGGTKNLPPIEKTTVSCSTRRWLLAYRFSSTKIFRFARTVDFAASDVGFVVVGKNLFYTVFDESLE